VPKFWLVADGIEGAIIICNPVVTKAIVAEKAIKPPAAPDIPANPAKPANAPPAAKRVGPARTTIPAMIAPTTAAFTALGI
jgi:hypothetical protein